MRLRVRMMRVMVPFSAVWLWAWPTAQEGGVALFRACLDPLSSLPSCVLCVTCGGALLSTVSSQLCAVAAPHGAFSALW